MKGKNQKFQITKM